MMRHCEERSDEAIPVCSCGPLDCFASLAMTILEGAQVLAALAANRDEGHETGLRQRVAPAMAGSVLHDAITLAQMDPLSVVQFQRHLAANHDRIVDGVRCVHARSAAFEMVAHAGDLLR